MKHRPTLALFFILGCATGGVAAQLVVPPVRAGTSPTRWEYQCASSEPDEVTGTANKLGAAGWELVSVAPARWAGSVAFSVKEFTVCAKRALP